MKHVVGKEFTFDAAHQLPLHDGKCRHLHGHTYRVAVIASGPLILEGSKSGMVVDFGDLSTIWKEQIEPMVDHQNLNETVPVQHTTAEMLAGWMLDVFRQYLAPPLTDLSVTVHETVGSWARAS